MAPELLRRISVPTAVLLLGAFLSGFLVHLVYGRWSGPCRCAEVPAEAPPSAAGSSAVAEPPVVDVMEVERLQALDGVLARIRGRVHRVGHSSRSNTWFLDFGPSRAAFTAVIFSSSVEGFLRGNVHPEQFQGLEVELTGRIRDHPKYGLQMVLESPAQIKALP